MTKLPPATDATPEQVATAMARQGTRKKRLPSTSKERPLTAAQTGELIRYAARSAIRDGILRTRSTVSDRDVELLDEFVESGVRKEPHEQDG